MLLLAGRAHEALLLLETFLLNCQAKERRGEGVGRGRERESRVGERHSAVSGCEASEHSPQAPRLLVINHAPLHLPCGSETDAHM